MKKYIMLCMAFMGLGGGMLELRAATIVAPRSADQQQLLEAIKAGSTAEVRNLLTNKHVRVIEQDIFTAKSFQKKEAEQVDNYQKIVDLLQTGAVPVVVTQPAAGPAAVPAAAARSGPVVPAVAPAASGAGLVPAGAIKSLIKYTAKPSYGYESMTVDSYMQEFSRMFRTVKAILRRELEKLKKEHQGSGFFKPAGAIDIDGTILDDITGEAIALPGALEFLQEAKDLGIELAFITAREKKWGADTVKQLNAAFPELNILSSSVYSRPDGQSDVNHKLSIRKNLVDRQGYTMVFTAGDNSAVDFSLGSCTVSEAQKFLGIFAIQTPPVRYTSISQDSPGFVSQLRAALRDEAYLKELRNLPIAPKFVSYYFAENPFNKNLCCINGSDESGVGTYGIIMIPGDKAVSTFGEVRSPAAVVAPSGSAPAAAMAGAGPAASSAGAGSAAAAAGGAPGVTGGVKRIAKVPGMAAYQLIPPALALANARAAGFEPSEDDVWISYPPHTSTQDLTIDEVLSLERDNAELLKGLKFVWNDALNRNLNRLTVPQQNKIRAVIDQISTYLEPAAVVAPSGSAPAAAKAPAAAARPGPVVPAAVALAGVGSVPAAAMAGAGPAASSAGAGSTAAAAAGRPAGAIGEFRIKSVGGYTLAGEVLDVNQKVNEDVLSGVDEATKKNNIYGVYDGNGITKANTLRPETRDHPDWPVDFLKRRVEENELIPNARLRGLDKGTLEATGQWGFDKQKDPIDIANYLARRLPKIMQDAGSDLEKIRKGFQSVQDELLPESLLNNGATAVIAHIMGDQIIVANAGDAPCVLYTTTDHTNSFVELSTFRVVSTCFGDKNFKVNVNVYKRRGDEKFLLVMSDGILKPFDGRKFLIKGIRTAFDGGDAAQKKKYAADFIVSEGSRRAAQRIVDYVMSQAVPAAEAAILGNVDRVQVLLERIFNDNEKIFSQMGRALENYVRYVTAYQDIGHEVREFLALRGADASSAARQLVEWVQKEEKAAYDKLPGLEHKKYDDAAVIVVVFE